MKLRLLIYLCAAMSLAVDGRLHAGDGSARCVLRLEPEIDCPSCEDGIKHLLVTARGVQAAEIDVLTNRVTVRYDPARTNVKTLVGRIGVTGYRASEAR